MHCVETAAVGGDDVSPTVCETFVASFASDVMCVVSWPEVWSGLGTTVVSSLT